MKESIPVNNSEKSSPRNYDVIVVGAGAAGILAAGRAAHLGAEVLLLEKMNRAGRKILITGKGRCNITCNAPMDDFFQNIFPKARFLKHAFHSFFVDDILKILHDQGVETTTERGNRVFPVSNDASEVLNAIWNWMGKRNIDVRYGCRVKKLLTENGKVSGVIVLTDRGEKQFTANAVIIATGGRSYPATGSTGDGYALAEQTGHKVTEVFPALVPLVTKEETAARLMGLGLKNVRAIVWVNSKKQKEEFGEVMFAHYGITGPIILTISRFVVQELSKGHRVEISIDLKPALDEQKLDTRLLRDLNEHGKKQLDNIFKLWLPSKMIPEFLVLLGLDGKKLGNQVSGSERKSILRLMKDLRFIITGHPGYKEAIITAGGVSTKNIQPDTMQSKLIENLYFAGEVLDLDGNTGGYNLQIAFSTGWLAGNSAGKKAKSL